MYDVTAWLKNNGNTHIYQYLKEYQAMKFSQLKEHNMRILFS